MLALGIKRILALFIGSMGIKSAHLGEKTIYERPGGFLYIELKSEENTRYAGTCRSIDHPE